MGEWISWYWTNPMDNGEFPSGTKHMEKRFDAVEGMLQHLCAEARAGSVWNCEIITPYGDKVLQAHSELLTMQH